MRSSDLTFPPCPEAALVEPVRRLLIGLCESVEMSVGVPPNFSKPPAQKAQTLFLILAAQ